MSNAATTAEEARAQALALLLDRNLFYRAAYRHMAWAAVTLLAAILVLGFTVIGTLVTSRPVDRYFATTETGAILQLVPLGQPTLDDDGIRLWAAKAVQEIMTFGFHDYRLRIQRASRLFTQQGYGSFYNALAGSRLIPGMEENHKVGKVTIDGAVRILGQGYDESLQAWVWRVRVPAIIDYSSASASRAYSYDIELLIIRVSNLYSPQGLGIQQWVQHPRKEAK